jgi:hypothetical protein
MRKNLFILSLSLLLSCQLFAQNSSIENPEFYVNLFINSDKNIYVETQKTNFENIENEISLIIRNKPFKLDQKIVYRIFADENLNLGYIMDVNQEMLSAYDDNVKTERFLLNTIELNIDGENWFESKKIKELKGN